MEDNIKLDSDEEMYFLWWLEELKAKGYVKDYTMQPEAFKLFEGIAYTWYKPKPTKKEPNRTEFKENWLLEPAEYTTDARIVWEPKAQGIFYNPRVPLHSKCNLLIANNEPKGNEDVWRQISFVEVKPSFDQNNMTRLFVTKQKWVYGLYSIYVNLITPVKLFEKTFTPTRYLFTNKSGAKRTLHHKVRTLEEYVEIMKKQNNLVS